MVPWTVTHHTPLIMKFSRQDYWSGLAFPPPRDFPDPGIEPASPASPALPGGFFTAVRPGEPHEWDQCPYKRDSGELLHSSWPCKGTKRSWGSSQPRDHTRSLALEVDSLPSESPGKSTRKSWQSGTQKRIFTRTQSCWYPDLRLQASWTMREKFLLIINHSGYGILL